MRSLFLAALLIGAVPIAFAQAAPDTSPHSQADLVAVPRTIAPGQPFLAALRLRLDPHWHSYWINPGDAGYPVRITWTLDEGWEVGEIRWPTPQRIEPPGDANVGVMSYGYEVEVLHLIPVTPPASLRPGTTVTLQGQAEWLVCEEICLPAEEAVSLTLQVSTAAEPSPDAPALMTALAALPVRAEGVTARAVQAGNSYVLELTPPPGAVWPADPEGVYFFADTTATIEPSAPQAATWDEGKLHLALQRSEYAQGTPTRLGGVLTAPAGQTFDGHAALWVEAAVVAEGQGTGGTPQRGLSLGLALVLAFVGGLLLNLMPCVFPVLTLKVMGLMHGVGTAQQRRNGWLFGAGVLVSFWILAGLLLALRAAGESLGWGFQLQNPLFVGALALLFLALGLNLLGVFEVGMNLQAKAGALDRGEGPAGAFGSGVLASVIATPCTAPFMGAALGYAIAQPPAVAMLVFTFLGVGMAAPYVLLTQVPAWLRKLPRPGPWMTTFKQVMAFPLFATVAWLAWVYASQVGTTALGWLAGGLAIVVVNAWLYGRQQRARVGVVVGPARFVPAIALLGAIGLTYQGTRVDQSVALAAPGFTPSFTAGTAPVDAHGWEPFDQTRLQALVAAGTPVFVDFTATWCLTCQVNKKTTLHTEAVEAAFAARGVVRMRADWTNRNPAITRALERLGRSGVPVYAFYDGSATPVLLPEVLTPGLVLAAVE